MGIAAIPFAVDINKVKSVFGCKDNVLMKKIKEAEMYDTYESQNDNFDLALEEIFFKYIKPEDRKTETRRSFWGFKKSKSISGLNESTKRGYSYVLLVICDYFGTHLLPHWDGFYYGRDLKAAFEIMRQYGLQYDLDDMFEDHDVFDIPKKDGVAIRHFTKLEIAQINAVLDKIQTVENKTDFDKEEVDDVQEMLRDFKDCFKYCEQHDIEMITFTH